MHIAKRLNKIFFPSSLLVHAWNCECFNKLHKKKQITLSNIIEEVTCNLKCNNSYETVVRHGVSLVKLYTRKKKLKMCIMNNVLLFCWNFNLLDVVVLLQAYSVMCITLLNCRQRAISCYNLCFEFRPKNGFRPNFGHLGLGRNLSSAEIGQI